MASINEPDVSKLLETDVQPPPNPAGGQATSRADEAAMSNEIWVKLKEKRGILSGRDLYQLYGEAHEQTLKAAIVALQKQNRIAVQGNLEAPLGVFKSVFAQKTAV